MNYRFFGSTGLRVSEIGFKCSHIGRGVMNIGHKESIRVLNRALELGEVFETLDYVKGEGKIRSYGVSAKTIGDAILCLKFSRVSSLQIEFNLLQQKAVKELFL